MNRHVNVGVGVAHIFPGQYLTMMEKGPNYTLPLLRAQLQGRRKNALGLAFAKPGLGISDWLAGTDGLMVGSWIFALVFCQPVPNATRSCIAIPNPQAKANRIPDARSRLSAYSM